VVAAMRTELHLSKKQFPHLQLDELSEKLKEMKEIEERLSRHNSENRSPEK